MGVASSLDFAVITWQMLKTVHARDAWLMDEEYMADVMGFIISQENEGESWK